MLEDSMGAVGEQLPALAEADSPDDGEEVTGGSLCTCKAIQEVLDELSTDQKIEQFIAETLNINYWTWEALSGKLQIPLPSKEMQAVYEEGMPEAWLAANASKHKIVDVVPAKVEPGTKNIRRIEDQIAASVFQRGMITQFMYKNREDGKNKENAKQVTLVYATLEAHKARIKILDGLEPERKRAAAMYMGKYGGVTSSYELVELVLKSQERALLTFDSKTDGNSLMCYAKNWYKLYIDRVMRRRLYPGLSDIQVGWAHKLHARMKRGFQETGKNISLELAMKELNVPEGLRQKVAGCIRQSSSTSIATEDGVTKDWLFGGHSPKTPEDEFMNRRMIEVLESNALGPIPALVLKVRYGLSCPKFDDHEVEAKTERYQKRARRTSRSIARHLGLPLAECVDLIERDAELKLRKLMSTGSLKYAEQAREEIIEEFEEMLHKIGCSQKVIDVYRRRRPYDGSKSTTAGGVAKERGVSRQAIDTSTNGVILRICGLKYKVKDEEARQRAEELYEEVYGYDPILIEKGFVREVTSVK